MKVSHSTDLVMQFAAYEAISGRFREIEPEHLLMAILKLAELPTKEAEKLVFGERAVRQLQEEIEAIRAELVRRSVESAQSRRELRATLGLGDSRHRGGTIHRSASSRAVFDEAARLADEAGNEALSAEYLLEALLLSPTMPIQQVLGQAVGAKKIEQPDALLLSKYGIDLSEFAKESKLPQVSGRQAEAEALIEVVGQANRRSVLLINGSDEVVQSVAFAAAQALKERDRRTDRFNKRIIQVMDLEPWKKLQEETLGRLGELFAEASSLENVVLLVPALRRADSADITGKWAHLLQRTLAKGSIQLIFRVDPATYQDVIHKNSAWKRLAHIMWIQDEVGDQIPQEL